MIFWSPGKPETIIVNLDLAQVRAHIDDDSSSVAVFYSLPHIWMQHTP
jgi:hypothetical protein